MNLISAIRRRLNGPTRRGERGIAAVEFAMAMPVLVTMLYGGFELTRFIMIVQKSERIAHTVADIVAQSENSISASQMNDILLAAAEMMEPFAFGTDGIVIVSSVYRDNSGNPATKVRWQYSGGGTLSKSSQIGSTGGAASLPNGLTLNDKDNVVITEVYYTYTPAIADDIIPETEIYKTSIYKPRLGTLITPPT
ncbi:MAG: hypothetical protein GC131_07735 [Alphaproteobacteria bacterium]|nr:hypothetical protein [Alphaproteobacteria bacterium]